MKQLVLLPYALSLVLSMTSCGQKTTVSPNQTCDDEHVLEVYQNKEAKVIVTELKRYCLTVDAAGLARNDVGYRAENVLVPMTDTDIPTQYQVEGLHVLLSGQKKSCFGLTSLPMVSGPFGYKLEVEVIKELKTTK